MLTRSLAVVALAACASDQPVGGAGSGGAPVVDGTSPECERWANAFRPCTGENPIALRELLESCLVYSPCQAEADAYWACAAPNLEKNCSAKCSESGDAVLICMLTVADCVAKPDGCTCTGIGFQPPTATSCEVIEGEAGGSGGGAAAPVVQCQCLRDGKLVRICQQDTVDCGLGSSCCDWDGS